MGKRQAMIDLRYITKVTICSSSKFYSTARHLERQLVAVGMTVFTPRFDYDEDTMQVTLDDKVRLTREFLGKIRRSDAIYVIDQGGYTGVSVCVEMGYAAGQRKTIILSEPATDGAITALADAVIPIDMFPAAIGEPDRQRPSWYLKPAQPILRVAKSLFKPHVDRRV